MMSKLGGAADVCVPDKYGSTPVTGHGEGEGKRTGSDEMASVAGAIPAPPKGKAKCGDL